MKLTKSKKKSSLEQEIEDVLKIMSKLQPGCEEYTACAGNLERLYNCVKSNEKVNSINWNTVLLVGGNLAGIAMILGFEKVDIITSKALGFVMKGRV